MDASPAPPIPVPPVQQFTDEEHDLLLLMLDEWREQKAMEADNIVASIDREIAEPLREAVDPKDVKRSALATDEGQGKALLPVLRPEVRERLEQAIGRAKAAREAL